ncbi:MAG: alginate lyase family protein [Acidobacteria bacterium]|nr:alginate lyase family protein [Acidobacteriota bacterium]
MNEAAVGKLKRMREMTAAEIAWRIRDKFRSEGERFWFLVNSMDKPAQNHHEKIGNSCLADIWKNYSDEHGSSFKRYLQTGPGKRFYLPAGSAEGEAAKELVNRYFPEWTTKAIEEAERLGQHRVELVGYGEIELGREINWHRDPVSGQVWPRRFWADYDLVHETTADPKLVHELNRQQHLPRLAKAYFLTGEEKYAREAVQQIVSWMTQNPPGCGVHWHSSLEIAVRAISWLWTLFFILPAESLDESTAREIGGSLFIQLDHISRHLSVYSSPNTHLLGEAAALFIGGTIFSDCERAREWQQTGASLLIQEMGNQVLREGVHGELSAYYHCYAVDFYLQALVLAERNQLSFPNRVWRRFGRMLDFLMNVSRPDGSIPLLGDEDGGRALALSKTNYRSFSDALGAGAVLFRRTDLKHQSREFWEETFWLLGEPGWNIYRRLDTTPRAELSASYPAAGYFIQRSGGDDSASHLVFDCGGMGILTGGHAHADSLSITLSAGDKELLVDPGVGLYNLAPQWRDFFRSTSAHNTVVVDGQQQSEAAGTFRWKEAAESRVIKQLAGAGVEYIEGEHAGYRRLPQPVVHRRRILHCRPDYWVMVDDFRGEGEHVFELYYHFAYEAEISFNASTGLSPGMEFIAEVPGAGLRLFLCSSIALRTEIVCGQTKPIQGWVSSRYGEKRAAPVLRASFRSSVPAAIVSVLIPYRRDPGAAERWQELCKLFSMAAGEKAIACAVENGNRKDWLVFSLKDSESELGSCRMRGKLFWLRNDGGLLTQFLGIEARSLLHNGQTLLPEGDPLDYEWTAEESASVRQARATERDEVGELAYVRDLRDC